MTNLQRREAKEETYRMSFLGGSIATVRPMVPVDIGNVRLAVISGFRRAGVGVEGPYQHDRDQPHALHVAAIWGKEPAPTK